MRTCSQSFFLSFVEQNPLPIKPIDCGHIRSQSHKEKCWENKESHAVILRVFSLKIILTGVSIASLTWIYTFKMGQLDCKKLPHFSPRQKWTNAHFFGKSVSLKKPQLWWHFVSEKSNFCSQKNLAEKGKKNPRKKRQKLVVPEKPIFAKNLKSIFWDKINQNL